MRQRASISQRKVDWHSVQVNEFSRLPEDLSTKSVFRMLEREHEKVNCQFRSLFAKHFLYKIFNRILLTTPPKEAPQKSHFASTV